MDTNENNKKCTCDKDCSCKKEKKSITEKIVDSIQEDIAAIIKTVKDTERS
jgi:hypothetical protein